MNFESLVNHISAIQNTLQAQATHSVNLALTSRNRLMGCYIVEFRRLYLAYPQLKEEVLSYVMSGSEIWHSLTAEFTTPIRRMPSAEFPVKKKSESLFQKKLGKNTINEARI